MASISREGLLGGLASTLLFLIYNWGSIYFKLIIYNNSH